MHFVCVVCMQVMTHSLDNVPSQQAVELVVLGLVFFFSSVGLDCLWETSFH